MESKKTIYVNVNFDDFHPQSDAAADFGGDGESGVLNRLKQLTVRFPGLIITLFTTPDWIDAPRTQSRFWYVIKSWLGMRPVVPPLSGHPWLLLDHPIWCAQVAELVAGGSFEIAVHGLHHYNPATRIHGMEFYGLGEQECVRRIREAERIFSEAHIPYIKLFRPPGWADSPQLLHALAENGYRHYAGHVATTPTMIEGMKNFPQNWRICQTPQQAIAVAERDGFLAIKGHIASRYGNETIENGITTERYENLEKTLQLVEDLFDVRYVSAIELIDRLHQT